MTKPFGEHTCACGQPADRHRFIGGWMCGACAKKQDHHWIQENPMTRPDRPATDLDASCYTYGYGIINAEGRFKGVIDKDGYEGTSVYGPDERRVRAAIVPEEHAKSITTLRAQLADAQERARNCAVASLGWENRANIAAQDWANAEAARMKQHVELEDTHRELATAETRVAELEAALRPLAEKFLSPDDIDKDMPVGARMCDDEDYDAAANDEQVDDVWIKRGDIRRARNALRGGDAT